MKRTKFTMLTDYSILSLLFMLNLYLVQGQGGFSGYPLETKPVTTVSKLNSTFRIPFKDVSSLVILPFETEIKVIVFLNNTFRISFTEQNYSYKEAKILGFFECVNGLRFHDEFSGDFSLNGYSREWVYFGFISYNCLDIDTFLFFGVTAFNSNGRAVYVTKSQYNINDNTRINLAEKPITTTLSQNIETQTTNPKIKACDYSKTTINYNQKVCKGELIFEDDFNKMDWNKWNRDIRIPLDSEDADFVSFQHFEENLYIRDGILYILPKLLTELTDHDERSIRTGTLNLGLNCTGAIDRSLECIRKASTFNILPPVVSTRIRTKNIFSFKYGVIEIRAKLPKGDWIFPQLFLEPSTNLYGMTNYSSGQIRIAFIRSNEMLDSKDKKQIDGYRLYGGVVLVQGEKLRELWMKDVLRRRSHFGDDFHIYKTIWTDEFISFEIDGEEYGKLEGNFAYEAFDLNEVQHAEYWKTGNKMSPFDKEFFLTLGVSVGGISDFPDDSICGQRDSDKKPWENLDMKNELNFWKAKDLWHSTWIGENAALKVDYIRVWAQ